MARRKLRLDVDCEFGFETIKEDPSDGGATETGWWYRYTCPCGGRGTVWESRRVDARERWIEHRRVKDKRAQKRALASRSRSVVG